MEIVLVRHGQPEWVVDDRNVVDPRLTELGTRQAEQTGAVLGAEKFDEVIVSPLRRARMTAAPLLRNLSRDENIEPWLHEIREPDWHGTPSELAAKAYAEERSRPAEERWRGVEGGEPSREFVERVRAGATGFLAARGMYRSEQTLPVWHIEKPDTRLAIVAHAGVDGVLLSLLLGLDPVPWEWDRFVTGHASITRLETMELGDGYTFSLIRLSDVEHLGPDERTR
ncbi:MAG: histidine phosphatase family protein [Ilumatobacteraceae bacterium]